MPLPNLSFLSIIGLLPGDLFNKLKSFLTGTHNVIVFDYPFKISTKYTTALLIVMTCITFANQFVRDVEINCGITSGFVFKGAGMGKGTQFNEKTEFNDYCWNHETFIVEKGLHPDMRGMVAHPGVVGYHRDRDELIKQRYYKNLWFVLCILACLSYLPYFVWKVRGTDKLTGLTELLDEREDITMEQQRVSFFLETLGFNDSFAYFYYTCKILATITPVGQWYFLCGFIGRRYRLYGVDVLELFLDNSDPWPNPMDALFPKVSKCEWAVFGLGGDREVTSGICYMPMNNFTQWSFFIYWWWTAFVFTISLFSCIQYLVFLLPLYRRQQYRSIIERACRGDLEKARTYTVLSRGQIVTKKHSKRKIMKVDISFGDWLVLCFIKRNLKEWEFRDVIRRMVVTENHVLQLKAVPRFHNLDAPMTASNEQGGRWNQNNQGANRAPNGEIGFNSSILNGISTPPPTYTTFAENFDNPEGEPLTSGAEILDSDAPLAPPQQMFDESSFGETGGNTIDITPAVKISCSERRTIGQKKSKDPKSAKKKETGKKSRFFSNFSSTPAPSSSYVYSTPANTKDDNDEWNAAQKCNDDWRGGAKPDEEDWGA